MITKAKQRLFLLKKSFQSKNPSILVLGFKTYIIPLLEYCSPVWNPHAIVEIRRIESVQRLFTKRLTGFNGLNYPDRLNKAGLCTLELRRLRADLCLCYNILHGNIETDIKKFFEVDKVSQTRGHTWRLRSIVPRLDSRLYFFSFRVINVWNALTETTVSAASIASFRSSLEQESLDRFLIIKD
jgi:hypothetical protein